MPFLLRTIAIVSDVILLSLCLLLCGGCRRVEAGLVDDWIVVTAHPHVEVSKPGGESDFAVRLRNTSANRVRVRVANISCGCVTAIDQEIALAPFVEGEMRFRARPRLLVPTEERILLADLDARRTREIVVTMAARTGLQVTPTSLVLRDPIDANLRSVAELLVAVPEPGGTPTIVSRFLPPDEDSIAVITDPPRIRRSERGIAVFVVPIHVVGLKNGPRVVRECALEAQWQGGSGQAGFLLTAGVELQAR